MMHGFGFGTFGWFGMIINLLIPLVVIIALIWFIVWLVRSAAADKQQKTGQDSLSPKEILQARYARGEIDRLQYQQMLNDLSS